MRYFVDGNTALLFIGITACRQDTPLPFVNGGECSDDSWRHKMNDMILREAMFP